MWIAENILRPLLTAHHAQVSTLAIFVGAIGGAAAFGILGLVIGPVLLSFVGRAGALRAGEPARGRLKSAAAFPVECAPLWICPRSSTP